MRHKKPQRRDRNRERYAIGLLIEEPTELAQILAKVVRFGDDVMKDKKARAKINHEVGDVLAAIDYAIEAGIIDVNEAKKQHQNKTSILRGCAP